MMAGPGASRSERDNNFNILRVVAAVMVIVAHGLELPTKLELRDFAHNLTGHSLGWYAVSLFFTISGYLVLGSWDRNPSLGGFLRNRILRIWPGLLVMLVLTVIMLGIFFGSLPLPVYLASGETWRYLLGCLSIVGVQYTLPGVFDGTPLKVVNGSLWTLRFEIACYALLAGLGALGVLARPAWRRAILAAAACAAIATCIVIDAAGIEKTGRVGLYYEFGRLGLSFVLGAIYHDARRHLPLNLMVLAVLAVLAGLAVRTPLFVPLACLALAYATFWIAFVPDTRWLRATRRMPDYSYGLYIYAFPVQQAIIAAIPGASPATVILLGTLLTLLPSALSWHLVEKPALNLKNGFRRHALDHSIAKADHVR